MSKPTPPKLTRGAGQRAAAPAPNLIGAASTSLNAVSAGAVKRTPSVAVEMGVQAEYLDNLHLRLGELVERLTPVLSAEAPVDPSSTGLIGFSPLSESLERHNLRISNAVACIDSLLNRLEV